MLSGALRVFLRFEKINTSCDITLVGWSSIKGRSIGQDVWEGSISRDAGYEVAPELKQFLALEDARAFSLSAIFQFAETEKALIATGSPVLMEKVRNAAAAEIKVEFRTLVSRRAPVASIQGKGAVSVGKLSVENYSRYVAGLFENFD
jgi:hypothetical protein